MSLNIIIKSGTNNRKTNAQIAEGLSRANQEAVIREKATYDKRSRELRKGAEKFRKGNGAFRLESIMDARTYMRHAQERPGSMSDDTYRKELLRDNPEIDCR
tara:strand:- start:231 stop:536 length:306 start_codon:yes stop_codon:yes gene_type:complete